MCLRVLGLVALGASLGLGCGDPGGGGGDGSEAGSDSEASGSSADATSNSDTGPETGCDKVDILYSIDDSGSMSDNQDKLTAVAATPQDHRTR